MSTVTYKGIFFQDGPMIASDTNPWVEVDGKPVDWTTSTLPQVECPCGEHLTVVPGVIAPIDTPEGVNRCDAAETFDGDLSAAFALARLVGGVVKYEAADPADLTSDEELAFERRILEEGR